MGNTFKKIAGFAFALPTGGASLAWAMQKKPKMPQVSTAAAQDLTEEKADSSKKRKALYATKGGVLGQEVSQVGNADRGSLFGN